jgi:hemerythrin-like metal-binding protein
MSTTNALFGRIQMQHHSINTLIQWGEHLTVEHPEIDAQHKALYDLGTTVYEKWRAGASVNALRPAVEKLTALLKDHFSYEEQVLKEIGYADLDEHVAEHRSMLAEMELVREQFYRFEDDSKPTGGSLLAPGWPVLQLILGFIIGHVSTSDMGYCRALVASRTVS